MFDFDGTLADVVEDPAAARPRPGVVDHLAALGHRYRQVCVVSGRPVGFLADHLPGGLFLSGLYGMEEVDGGQTVVPDEFLRWQDAVTGAVSDLTTSIARDGRLTGLEVEDKGLSVTVHYRRHPELGEAAVDLATRIAGRHSLEVRPARMSVEVHPPVPADKGTVVRRVIEGVDGVEAAVFVGDDVGDLPAFTALAELRSEGLTTAAVAVASSEMDPRMREQADITIAGSDVEELLRALRFGAGADG
ncbi:MAG: trehalose-phosphatase [Acidimicrobiales bacterium]|nr:trehalose-phosphatase [Acidimicrobiales bacterium]